MTKEIDVYHSAVEVLNFPIFDKDNAPFDLLVGSLPLEDERCVDMMFKDIGGATLRIARVVRRPNGRRSFVIQIMDFPRPNRMTVVLPIFKQSANFIRFTENRMVNLINLRLVKVLYE